MVITRALRNDRAEEIRKTIDYLYIDWYQASKRIQRLRTSSGMPLAIRFLGQGQDLREGDVLYEDENKVVMVSILPCEVIAFTTTERYLLSLVAYELGNIHVPLFSEGSSLYIPYERAMHTWFTKQGYPVAVVQRKLCNPLNANVNYSQLNKVTITPPSSGLSLKL